MTRNDTRGTGAATVGLLALAAVLTIMAAAPLASASPPSFDGGVGAEADHPSFVANDHSVYAVRFVAHGLTPAAAYRLRIGFAIAPDSAAAPTDRGFIWSSASQRWIAADASQWAEFPTITSDEWGSYEPGDDAGWFFIRFGDTRVTGTRFLVASLSGLGGGEAMYGASQPAVTAFDPRTQGYWVHNKDTVLAHDGTVQEAAKRVELVAGLPAVDRFALQRSEPNSCDDDGDGIVDNEGRLFYATGDTDITGDFRMALLIGSPSWYLYEGEPPSPDASFGQGFTNLLPDTDLALDAVGDTVPPSAPDGLTAKATPGKITLTWGAADDAAVGRYLVYRWTDSLPSDPFTPVKAVVARTPESQLTYEDTDVAPETSYHYEVRAEDGQTNVGPRSNEATATVPTQPVLEPTTLTLGPVPTRIAYAAPFVLTATLSDGSGQPLSGQTVLVSRWRVTDPDRWTSLGPCAAGDTPGTYTFVAGPIVRTYYRFSFATTGAYAGAAQTTSLLPKLKMLGTPVAPARVPRDRYFTVYGYVKPHLANGAHSIVVECYRWSGGRWVLKKTASATNHPYSSFTKYRARLRLTTRGTWRLRALYRETGPLSPFARTWSGYRAVHVTR